MSPLGLPLDSFHSLRINPEFFKSEFARVSNSNDLRLTFDLIYNETYRLSFGGKEAFIS